MEGKIITLEMADWLYNAGIVGLVNILEHSGMNVNKSKDKISFNVNDLENFEEMYFKYFIDTYEKKLSWYKIVEFEEFIEKYEVNALENFNEKELEKLNNYIVSTKKLLASNSFKSAYQLTENTFDILGIEKSLKSIKLKKSEIVKDKLTEIREAMNIIKEIIKYCSLDNVKRYITGKNVIYTIINNAWNGVSFLNQQNERIDKKTGEYANSIEIRDIYTNYKNYFVEEAYKYICEDKSTYKYDCFICGDAIKSLENDLSFLNACGFDTSRKPSHVWNFNNDIAVCPVCKLIYSCVPAGFSYVYNKGIYINANHSVENAFKINKTINYQILKDEEMNQNTTYKAMILAMQETINDSAKYELSDIQVIRYENNDGDEKYRFNILSKNLLSVLNKSKEDMNLLLKASYKEVDTYFRIYEEVFKKLFNNENLFFLIHKMLVLKISKPSDAFFNLSQVFAVLRINLEYQKGVGYMETIEKDMLKSYSGAGYYLKQAYKEKNSENKLNGISYKLLNALKTNNKGMFMDTLLNCYLYTGKQVPSFFTECLKETEIFKTIGYAFVSGLIDGEGKNKENDNQNGGK